MNPAICHSSILQFVHAATIILWGIPLTYLDFRWRRLPNLAVGTFAIVAILTVVLASIVGGLGVRVVLRSTAGAVAMTAFYLLIAGLGGFRLQRVIVRRQEPPARSVALGGGDIKLAAPLGLATGSLGLDQWLTALLAPFILGGMHALALITWARIRRRAPPSDIAFGPWMLLGAVLALL